MESAYLIGELHGLQGQLPGGGQDERPGPRGLRALQLLEHGDEEGCALTAACPGHSHDVLTVQDHRDSLPTHTQEGRGMGFRTTS